MITAAAFAFVLAAPAGRWEPIDSATEEPLWALDFADADVGWAVGDHGTILRTADGGATWLSRGAEVFNGFAHARTIRFIDADRGWVLADRHEGGTAIVATRNGGATWEVETEGPVGLSDLCFPAGDRGVACGRYGCLLVRR